MRLLSRASHKKPGFGLLASVLLLGIIAHVFIHLEDPLSSKPLHRASTTHNDSRVAYHCSSRQSTCKDAARYRRLGPWQRCCFCPAAQPRASVVRFMDEDALKSAASVVLSLQSSIVGETAMSDALSESALARALPSTPSMNDALGAPHPRHRRAGTRS